jgi:hypothetical protein
MATHSSATPHVTETTQITTNDALRRRAQSVLNDRLIDPQWRAIIRYALGTNDPWLADLVRRGCRRNDHRYDRLLANTCSRRRFNRRKDLSTGRNNLLRR